MSEATFRAVAQATASETGQMPSVSGALSLVVLVAAVVLGGVWSFESWASTSERMKSVMRERGTQTGRSALLLGATGATGANVLKELVARDAWTRVVVLSRRDLPDIASDKVEVVVVPDLAAGPIPAARLAGIDHFFNCIGTTRSKAGSADAFQAIEQGISESVAAAAAEAGVKTASVISAQGASPGRTWAPKWKLAHPFFYGAVMGEKELTLDRFPRATVFRPGMLHRTEGPASALGGLLPRLKVSVLAKAMLADAETAAPPVESDKEPKLFVSGNSVITKLASSL